MSDESTVREFPMSLCDAMISVDSLTTYQYYVINSQGVRVGYSEQENPLVEKVVDRLFAFRDQCSSDRKKDGKLILLSRRDASLILRAVRGCYDEMRDDPSGLHVLLQVDDPQVLATLAGRLESFIQSFPV